MFMLGIENRFRFSPKTMVARGHIFFLLVVLLPFPSITTGADEVAAHMGRTTPQERTEEAPLILSYEDTPPVPSHEETPSIPSHQETLPVPSNAVTAPDIPGTLSLEEAYRSALANEE